MADWTDEELMGLFQRGNAAAFERLFERYRVPLFNFLLRMMRFQWASAEDVLQEVFVKLARGRDLYDPRARFRPWLYTIARNHALNHLQSRAVLRAQQTVSLDAMREPAGGHSAREPAGPADTFQAVASKDAMGRLDRTIARLASPAREIFLMHAVDGLSHEEIALVLAMNPATVRTHFHRARAQLCRLLAGYPS